MILLCCNKFIFSHQSGNSGSGTVGRGYYDDDDDDDDDDYSAPVVIAEELPVVFGETEEIITEEPTIITEDVNNNEGIEGIPVTADITETAANAAKVAMIISLLGIICIIVFRRRQMVN